MTDPRHPFAAIPAGDPSDEAAREARHAIIVELIAAYADGELPAETLAQLDAHLVGCARCRRELALHGAVRRRLAALPPAPPAAELRARIAGTIAALPAPVPTAPRAPRVRVPRTAVAALVVALLAVLSVVGARAWRGAAEPAPVELAVTPVGRDALVGAVLADYRRVAAQDLPGRARDVDAVRAAVPFAVEPLRAEGLRLLAAWTTDVDGEPAAVLAYRWDDDVVVQYVVDDAHFFRSRAVRAGVAAGRALAARDDALALVAWPTPSAGSLVVGAVPVERLAAVWRAEQEVAERRGRGAP